MSGSISDFIPKYLPEADQSALVEQLRDFEGRSYYTTRFPDELLQGDGWSGFDVINLVDGSRDKIKGILLSNSCDADETNPRDIPIRLVFAPLVPLGPYIGLLRKQGLGADQIQNKIETMRRQRITSIFFLPKGGPLTEDHIVPLDQLYNVPLPLFRQSQPREKLFTLNQMGAYLFILKISIHFCRFSENLSRG